MDTKFLLQITHVQLKLMKASGIVVNPMSTLSGKPENLFSVGIPHFRFILQHLSLCTYTRDCRQIQGLKWTRKGK